MTAKESEGAFNLALIAAIGSGAIASEWSFPVGIGVGCLTFLATAYACCAAVGRERRRDFRPPHVAPPPTKSRIFDPSDN